jgi:hypothetical protein
MAKASNNYDEFEHSNDDDAYLQLELVEDEDQSDLDGEEEGEKEGDEDVSVDHSQSEKKEVEAKLANKWKFGNSMSPVAALKNITTVYGPNVSARCICITERLIRFAC